MTFVDHENLGVRPIMVSDIVELSEWCYRYHTLGPHQQPPLVRFNIGVYQISQGMSWDKVKQRENSQQSYLAGALHFIMAAKSVGCNPESLFKCSMLDLDKIYDGWTSWDDVLFNVGSATQQLIYNYHNIPGRASRFNKNKLETAIFNLVYSLISVVVADNRAELIHNEMQILTRDILRK